MKSVFGPLSDILKSSFDAQFNFSPNLMALFNAPFTSPPAITAKSISLL